MSCSGSGFVLAVSLLPELILKTPLSPPNIPEPGVYRYPVEPGTGLVSSSSRALTSQMAFQTIHHRVFIEFGTHF